MYVRRDLGRFVVAGKSLSKYEEKYLRRLENAKEAEE